MLGRSWTSRKQKQVVLDDDSISTVTTNTKSSSESYYHKNGIDSGGLYIGQPNVPESIYEPLLTGRGNRHTADRNGSFYSRQMKGHMNLLTACRNGSYNTVERLLKRGDDVNKSDCEQDHYVTPLHTALIHEHDAIVRLLLRHGADVHCSANNGWTPLHIAASNGRADVVEWLLDYNADVEAKDSRGWTPLFVACFRGHLSVVRLLLLDKRFAAQQQVNCTWPNATHDGMPKRAHANR
jgi:Ankyrin repeats (3 copies)/Ankyrin repeat